MATTPEERGPDADTHAIPSRTPGDDMDVRPGGASGTGGPERSERFFIPDGCSKRRGCTWRSVATLI